MRNIPHNTLASLRIWAKQNGFSYRSSSAFREAVDAVRRLPYSARVPRDDIEAEAAHRISDVSQGVLLQKHLEVDLGMDHQRSLLSAARDACDGGFVGPAAVKDAYRANAARHKRWKRKLCWKRTCPALPSRHMALPLVHLPSGVADPSADLDMLQSDLANIASSVTSCRISLAEAVTEIRADLRQCEVDVLKCAESCGASPLPDASCVVVDSGLASNVPVADYASASAVDSGGALDTILDCPPVTQAVVSEVLAPLVDMGSYVSNLSLNAVRRDAFFLMVAAIRRHRARALLREADTDSCKHGIGLHCMRHCGSGFRTRDQHVGFHGLLGDYDRQSLDPFVCCMTPALSCAVDAAAQASVSYNRSRAFARESGPSGLTNDPRYRQFCLAVFSAILQDGNVRPVYAEYDVKFDGVFGIAPSRILAKHRDVIARHT